MISENIIERLKQKNWFAVCKTSEECDLVLLACTNAGITWNDGVTHAVNFAIEPTENPWEIGYGATDIGIRYSQSHFSANGYENITELFQFDK